MGKDFGITDIGTWFHDFASDNLFRIKPKTTKLFDGEDTHIIKINQIFEIPNDVMLEYFIQWDDDVYENEMHYSKLSEIDLMWMRSDNELEEETNGEIK